ncbi:hypothetical protein LTR66_004852, partial [Elasticomyces elasticus]
MNPDLALASVNIGRSLSSQRMYIEFALNALYRSAIPASPSSIDRQHLASSVLQRRWMTWDMFQHILRVADDRYGREAPHPVADGDVESEKCPRHELGRRVCTCWCRIATYSDDLRTPLGSKYIVLRDGFRYPEKLLHGPWTDDKVSFLRYLVYFEAGSMDRDSSTLGEVAAK